MRREVFDAGPLARGGKCGADACPGRRVVFALRPRIGLARMGEEDSALSMLQSREFGDDARVQRNRSRLAVFGLEEGHLPLVEVDRRPIGP